MYNISTPTVFWVGGVAGGAGGGAGGGVAGGAVGGVFKKAGLFNNKK